MTSIFNPHFWHHIWGKWSEPKPAIITYVWGSEVGCMAQERECSVCGQREIRTL